MSGDGADLTEYRAALAFVGALEALLHPAPVGPFEDVDEMVAHAERLADTHIGNAALLFHLWLRWQAEGNVRAEPLEWLLVTLLLRHPGEGEAAFFTVCRRGIPAEAERLQRHFGDD